MQQHSSVEKKKSYFIAGIDGDCSPCVKFYRDGLSTSFIKILTDEAVSSWKYNIHHCILMSCSKLLHLISLHMKRDNYHLLKLLSVVFDPDNKFHTHNASRPQELHLAQADTEHIVQGSQIYANSPPEPKNPRGWLVDLINHFGLHKGFDNFQDRMNLEISNFRKQCLKDKCNSDTSIASPSYTKCEGEDNPEKLTLNTLHTLLQPFGQCAEFLTVSTVERYFMPIWDVVLDILESLSDDELKREAKFEGKNDIINGIVKYARALISHVPNQENLLRALEMCRLRIILRVLQISSFNGKMNALNEINKVLGYVSYFPHRQISDEDNDILNAEKMAVSEKNNS